MSGENATVYHHRASETAVLTWQRAGHGLTLTDHEADFSEADLIKLAESAGPPT